MITTLIVKMATMFIRFGALLLPRWSLPDYMINALNLCFDLIYSWNYFIPIKALMSMVVIILMFELAILVTRVVLGIISIIRGGGSLQV